jgi:hypothetical protein
MKFIKLSVLCLALLVAMPASADIASFFNPFAWIRAAQRTYHWKMNPAKMVAAQEELERLQKIEQRIENQTKIYNVLNQIMSVEQYDKERERGLEEDKKKFVEKFTARQRKWNLDNKTHYISGIDFFNKNVLQPALEKIAKENYIAEPKPHESWYEKRKKDVQNLPKKERNKTAKDRETEFKEWQKNKNDTDEVFKERNAWFEAWNAKNNPNYKK